ncbi:molybdate ABC transporter substrate-binding protein [Aquifex pyrophilus]
MLKIFLILFLFLNFTFSETLRIAAASSFRFTLEEIAKRFEKNYKHRVLISYGASGHFYIQIRHGAPYDVFISANEIYPKKLIEYGKALNESYTVFSKGKLVIFTLKDIELKNYEDITKAEKIAIANPKYAPYGKASLEFLKRTNLYEKVKHKLVYASNVSQAFQYVVSGGADAGLVALSLVIPYGKGKYLLIDEKLYAPINNVAVITLHGKDKKASWEFIEFLKTKEVKDILRKFGFGVP